jgi:C-terminal processing protease CtpA/Prc
LQGGDDEDTPTVVSKVVFNTPASRASLHEGDIIVEINNIDIRNHSPEEVN